MCHVYNALSSPEACQVSPVCTPPPCHTHPPGCSPGTGNTSVGTLGTHPPSAQHKHAFSLINTNNNILQFVTLMAHSQV